jgi:TRAP-type C4-dicarboxylate transport system permease small subunit
MENRVKICSGNLFDGIKGFLNKVSSLLNIFAAAIIGALTLLVVMGALMRYIIGKPFHFVDELSTLFFMALTVFSLTYVLKIERHVRIPIVLNRIPHRIRPYVELAAYLITLIFLAFLIKETWIFCYSTYNLKGLSPDASLPLFPWMALIPLNLIVFEMFVLVFSIEKMRKLFRKD